METQALDFPRIHAVPRENGTGEVTIDGTSHPIEAETEAEVLEAALDRTAAQLDCLEVPRGATYFCACDTPDTPSEQKFF